MYEHLSNLLIDWPRLSICLGLFDLNLVFLISPPTNFETEALLTSFYSLLQRTLMKQIHVKDIFLSRYAANLAFSSISVLIAGFQTLPCIQIHANNHTHHTFFVHIGHFHYVPFLGRPDLKSGALDHLVMLILMCIVLCVHKTRMLDTYNDTKCQ